MKTRTKTATLLAGTLIIGMILGSAVSTYTMRYRMRRMSNHLRTPAGFIERFEDIIQPTKEQKKAIRAVLEDHYEKMNRFHKEFPARMDSLKNDLDAILTEEQRRKLQDSMKKMRERGNPPRFDRNRAGPRRRPQNRPPFGPDDRQHFGPGSGPPPGPGQAPVQGPEQGPGSFPMPPPQSGEPKEAGE